MITPQLLKQAEEYLEWRCLDKNWFDYREKLGKPVNLRKLKIYAGFAERMKQLTSKNEKILLRQVNEHIKEVQAGSIEAHLGDDPQPITDAERAKMLETHRNYFANYLFELMKQKNFTEAEVAARARVDVAIFDKLRNERRYTPEERTIWALALALELNFDEANALLSRAPYMTGGHYCLSAKVQEEVLIAFFFDKRVYDLAAADEILKHYGFKTLEVTENFSALPDDKPFRDEGLLERIDLYLEKNFHDMSWTEASSKRGEKFSYSFESLGEPAESLKTFEVIIRKLKDKVGLAGSFFSDYLYKLIKQKNLSDVEVYKRAHLDRRIFSKIRNEKNYMPGKKTVLAIAFAMKLDFKEANTLLARAGYSLSEGRKEDVIAAYFIENQIYDLFLINEVLDYYGCPILGD